MKMVNTTIPLTFSVPEPFSRPGEAPDFSAMTIQVAGSVRRPDVSCPPHDMKDMARTMVRVLDRDGVAVGPWADPDLDPKELLTGLRTMMRMRAFDDRMLSIAAPREDLVLHPMYRRRSYRDRTSIRLVAW